MSTGICTLTRLPDDVWLDFSIFLLNCILLRRTPAIHCALLELFRRCLILCAPCCRGPHAAFAAMMTRRRCCHVLPGPVLRQNFPHRAPFFLMLAPLRAPPTCSPPSCRRCAFPASNSRLHLSPCCPLRPCELQRVQKAQRRCRRRRTTKLRHRARQRRPRRRSGLDSHTSAAGVSAF